MAGPSSSLEPLTLSDIQSPLPAARQYWLSAGASAALLDAAVVEVGALVPNLAGITIGNQITLDVDGAGWGWFVDASPASHQEFVATDENHAFEAAEFVAEPTSPAHGKLNLLTVLVHELGHVPGSLCISFAELRRTDWDAAQGVFLQPIAGLLANKATRRCAQVRLIAGRKGYAEATPPAPQP